MSEPKLREIYTRKQIILSIVSGLVFGTLISLPFVLVAINLLLLYIYHVYWLATLLVLVIAGWTVLIEVFNYKTLQIYKDDERIDYNKRIMKEGLIGAGIIVVLGLIFIIFFLPSYI